MRCAGLLVLVACAGAEATAPPAASTAAKPASAAPAGELGLTPGETMAFEITLAGIPAGEAQLAVGAIGDFEGHPALVVKSRAATAGAGALFAHIVDEATTVIDMASGRPLTVETLVEQGTSKTTATARLGTSRAEITYRRSGEPAPHVLRIDLGKATVHDAHSAMAQLRGWRAARGETRSVYVIGGRRLWRVDIAYAGDETIGSAIGNRRAVRFTGAAFRTRRDLAPETARPSRTFTVWLSDDADRVPLKLTAHTELGDVVIDLTEYSR